MLTGSAIEWLATIGLAACDTWHADDSSSKATVQAELPLGLCMVALPATATAGTTAAGTVGAARVRR